MQNLRMMEIMVNVTFPRYVVPSSRVGHGERGSALAPLGGGDRVVAVPDVPGDLAHLDGVETACSIATGEQGDDALVGMATWTRRSVRVQVS